MTDAELIRIGREAGLDIELMTEIGRKHTLILMRAVVEAERADLLTSIREHCAPPEAIGTDAGIGYDIALCNVQEFIRARSEADHV